MASPLDGGEHRNGDGTSISIVHQFINQSSHDHTVGSPIDITAKPV
jgi:hypothetical protein